MIDMFHTQKKERIRNGREKGCCVGNTRAAGKDALTDVLRQGVWPMLAQTIEEEVEAFLAAHGHIRDGRGRRLVVRDGYLPQRKIQTGIGDIPIKAPRVRDRGGSGIRFTSAILPPYLRRAKSIEELIPWLYLKGISTGDFSEALAALPGPDAPGISPRPWLHCWGRMRRGFQRRR